MENIEKSNFQSMQNMQHKEILSFKESLIYLDVSASFLYKLVSNRIITFSKPNGGKLYFRKPDLDSWMVQNQSKSIPVLENEINNHLKNTRNG